MMRMMMFTYDDDDGIFCLDNVHNKKSCIYNVNC